MKRIVLQIFLGLSGLLMLFRFGTPALILELPGRVPSVTAGWLQEQLRRCFSTLTSDSSAR
jgi:hypothetical protein